MKQVVPLYAERAVEKEMTGLALLMPRTDDEVVSNEPGIIHKHTLPTTSMRFSTSLFQNVTEFVVA